MTRSRLALRTPLVVLALLACDDVAPPEPAAPPDSGAAAAGTGIRRSLAAPASSAANACPPPLFASLVNHAANPSFEFGPGRAAWPPGASPIPSAAVGWFMHTRDAGTPIATDLMPTTAPGPAGLRMLAVRASGGESGVYQVLNTPAKVMFSVWVRVSAGHVVLGAHQMASMTPYAWSTKLNEWEQLRVCTDGTNPTGYFYVYNEDPRGGTFFIDRVEIRELP